MKFVTLLCTFPLLCSIAADCPDKGPIDLAFNNAPGALVGTMTIAGSSALLTYVSPSIKDYPAASLFGAWAPPASLSPGYMVSHNSNTGEAVLTIQYQLPGQNGALTAMSGIGTCKVQP